MVWIGLLALRGPSLLRGASEDVQDDGTHERITSGEAPVQGGDPDTCSARDDIQRRPSALVDERVARGGENQLAIPPGVGP